MGAIVFLHSYAKRGYFILLLSCAVSAHAQDFTAPGALRSSGPVTTEVSRKIVSHLRALVADFRSEGGITTLGSSVSERFSTAALKIDSSGRVQVYVTVTHATETVLRSLRQAGVDIEIVNSNLGIVQGWAPVNELEQIASLPDVITIRPPSYSSRLTGSATSAGDVLHRCDAARATGFTGTGIKVGVISDGVDGLAGAQTSGDLPPNVQVLSPGNGDEGTAMMEIVHDCAPGASLAFATGFPTSLAFIQAVTSLRDAGAQVIVDDLKGFAEPYFSDGPVAQNDRVVGSQTVRVAAAGNEGERHYQGTFTAGGFDVEAVGTRHVFSGTDTLMRIGFVTTVTLFLQWDNPFGAATDDYDLCARTVAGVLGSCSAFVQNGNDDPRETLTLSCPGGPCAADIQITRFAGAARTLELFCTPGCFFLQFNSPYDAVTGHQAVPEVLTVAATPASNPNTIEDFSSGGPSTILIPTFEVRQKPDLTGVDGVVTSRPPGGLNPFFGTSAAAPHVAAIAALVLDKNPGLSPQQVRDVLKQTAVDIGPAGFDFDFGFGRADALQAVNAVSTPPPPPPPGPSVELFLNGTFFRAGQTIVVGAALTPGSVASVVDGYVLVHLPAGGVLSLLLGNNAVSGFVPMARFFVPFQFTGEVFRYTFTGSEPAGTYSLQGLLTVPGTFATVDAAEEDTFTFLP